MPSTDREVGDIKHGPGAVSVPKIALTLNDQGGAVMNWNFRELAGTLRAEMTGHPPSVVIAISSTQEHATISEDGICPTIPAAAGEGGA